MNGKVVKNNGNNNHSAQPSDWWGAFEVFDSKELTNEARAEEKISFTMPCKEEEGEASY